MQARAERPRAQDFVDGERLFDSLGQEFEATEVLHNRAATAMLRGDLPRALELFDRAADRYAALSRPSPGLDLDRVEALLTAGLYDEAETVAREALSRPDLAPVKRAELLLAQAFMPTAFDWRVGVLGGKPIFVCQYMMAKKHWQIVKHRGDAKPLAGGHRTLSLGEAPPAVIDVGLRAAQLIGDTAIHGKLPEPLRIAHLIAGAFAEGCSRGGA